jgi:hypothetical protein
MIGAKEITAMAIVRLVSCRSSVAALAVLGLFGLTGCGGPATSTVSGTVTYKKQALPGGQVAFLSETTQQVYRGLIDSSGKYTVEKVPVGPVKIGVIYSGESPMAASMRAASSSSGTGSGGFRPRATAPPKAKTKGGFQPEGVDPSMTSAGMAPGANKKAVTVPEQYQSPESSGLSYTVVNGPQTHDIDIP